MDHHGWNGMAMLLNHETHETHEIGGNGVGSASTSTKMAGPGLAGPQAACFAIQPRSGDRM